MDAIFKDFAEAQRGENGYLLSTTITPIAPAADPGRLYAFHRSTNVYSVKTDLKYKLRYNPDLAGLLEQLEADAWVDIFEAYYKFVGILLAAEEASNSSRSQDADWSGVYDAWKSVVSQLSLAYQKDKFDAWTIPCLYVAGKYLRIFAIKADASINAQRDSGIAFGGLQEEDAFGGGGKNEKLEDAARQINGIFGICISDRAPIEDSRKWALYYIMNLLFKTYFKLNSLNLCKNLLRSLQASRNDMPALSSFPKAHQVTFQYYVGVIHFVEEDYVQAETHLQSAYAMCAKNARKNLQLILTYLIPTRLLTSHKLPTAEFLAPYPSLAHLFTPLGNCIKRGDLSGFDAALSAGEDEFVKRRIYLTLERGRDVAMRNLFRKVFLAGGWEAPKADPATGEASGQAVRRTRVPVNEFAAALSRAGAEVNGGNGVDYDEVECLIANLIYKNLMKGYIARERSTVVLSKAGAFPGTGV